MCIFCLLGGVKSKQISKIDVETWFQQYSGVIKYADFEYDIFKYYICICCLLEGVKSKQISKINVEAWFQRYSGVITYADS